MPTEEGRLVTELAIVRSLLRTHEVIEDPPTYRRYQAREHELQIALRALLYHRGPREGNA